MTGRHWYAPDPRLPHRDVVLDETALARHLAGVLPLPGNPVASVRRVRAKYLPGTSLRVVCSVRAADDVRLVAGRMFPGDISNLQAASALAATVPAGPLRPVTLDHALATIWWAFTNDRRIPGLAALDPPAPELAASLTGRWRRSRVVSLTPEKAALAACLDRRGEVIAYAKAYADGRGERVAAIHDALRAAAPAGIRVPSVLGSVAARGTLLLEPMPGRPLAELSERALPGALRALGHALARLHEAAAAASARALPPARHLEPERIAEAAAVIGSAFPPLAEAAAALCGELAGTRPPRGGPEAWLHGDLHLGNVLVADDGEIALIDLDRSACGPAAADLGGILARLRYRWRLGGLSADGEAALRDALLGGYRAAGALPDELELRWHTAASLLAVRLVSAVTGVRAESFRHLDRLIADGAELVAGAPVASV